MKNIVKTTGIIGLDLWTSFSKGKLDLRVMQTHTTEYTGGGSTIFDVLFPQTSGTVTPFPTDRYAFTRIAVGLLEEFLIGNGLEKRTPDGQPCVQDTWVDAAATAANGGKVVLSGVDREASDKLVAEFVEYAAGLLNRLGSAVQRRLGLSVESVLTDDQRRWLASERVDAEEKALRVAAWKNQSPGPGDGRTLVVRTPNPDGSFTVQEYSGYVTYGQNVVVSGVVTDPVTGKPVVDAEGNLVLRDVEPLADYRERDLERISAPKVSISDATLNAYHEGLTDGANLYGGN